MCGIANSSDAELLLQRDAGLIGPPGCLDAGDGSGDGKINAIDGAFQVRLRLARSVAELYPLTDRRPQHPIAAEAPDEQA